MNAKAYYQMKHLHNTIVETMNFDTEQKRMEWSEKMMKQFVDVN